jgi:DNA-3-methyladenine glycosylase II
MTDDPLLKLLPAARRQWARTDPVLHKLSKEHPPTARSVDHAPPFAALVTSITHQQVSLAAGRTIFGRVEAACGGKVEPEAILKLGPDGLRAAGLSRPKTAYVLDLAERALDGRVEFERFPTMTDAAIIEELTAVKGIGVWTAKMFLLFHLDRPDVSAPEDLGLQLAVARAYKVPRERAKKKMEQLAPRWSPYNSVGSLTLWHYRHVMDDRERATRPAPSARPARRSPAKTPPARRAKPSRSRGRA